MYFGKKLFSFSSFNRRSNSAFTLIEVLVVISIIAILAGITFGISSVVQDSQARSRAKAEIAILAQALEQFKSKNGDFPWTSSGYTSSSDSIVQSNGEELFLAMAGWKYFKRDSTGTFETKLPEEVPNRGPESFVEASKGRLEQFI
jgi:prepilin-type N-terminal cleavage/methylation domain-containing protein